MRSPAATKPCDSISRPPTTSPVRCGSSPRNAWASRISAATSRVASSACGRAQFLHRAFLQRDVDRPRSPGTATATPLVAEMSASTKSSNRSRLRTARPSSGLVCGRFDVRREDAGRRLRGAHAGRAFVDEFHRRAAARQLAGHGAPDDAGADDDDVGGARWHACQLIAHEKGVGSRFTFNEKRLPTPFLDTLARTCHSVIGH